MAALSEMAPTEVFEMDPAALKGEILQVQEEEKIRSAKVPDLSLTTSVDDGDEETEVDVVDVRSPSNTPCATTSGVPKQQEQQLNEQEGRDTAAAVEGSSSAQGQESPCPGQEPKEEDDPSSPKPLSKLDGDDDKGDNGGKTQEDETKLSEGPIDTPLLPMKMLDNQTSSSVLSPKQGNANGTATPDSTEGKETPSPSRFQSFVDNMLAKAKANNSAVKQQPQGEDGKIVEARTTWWDEEPTKDKSPSNSADSPSLGDSPKAAKEKQQTAATAELSTLVMPSLETKTTEEQEDPSTSSTNNTNNDKKEGTNKPLLGGFLSQAAKGLMNKRSSSSISNESSDSSSSGLSPSNIKEEEEKISSSTNVPTRSRTNNKHDHNEQELAHSLEDHTYSKPTNCDICSGLLVGLWSQGLQCKLCGLNVHRGEGIGGHDDCRAEALLMGCPGEHHCKDQNCNSPGGGASNKKEPVRMREVIEQMRQMAKEKPNFLQEVKAQLDRDFSSQIKGIIVSNAAEEQKSKSLLRARHVIVPFIEQVDGMEPRGTLFIYSVLFLVHVAVAVLVGFIGWVGFILALAPKYGLLTKPAVNLAHIHNMTVAYSFHVSVVLVVVFLRRLINLMNRKSTVLDHFLREVFKLEAEKDLGISVNGVAKRAQLWIRRVTNSSCIMCLVALVLWHSSQPPPSLFQPFAIA